METSLPPAEISYTKKESLAQKIFEEASDTGQIGDSYYSDLHHTFHCRLTDRWAAGVKFTDVAPSSRCAALCPRFILTGRQLLGSLHP